MIISLNEGTAKYLFARNVGLFINWTMIKFHRVTRRDSFTEMISVRKKKKKKKNETRCETRRVSSRVHAPVIFRVTAGGQSVFLNLKMLTRRRATPDRPVGVAVIALSRSFADKPACNTCYTHGEVPSAPRGWDEISGLSSP